MNLLLELIAVAALILLNGFFVAAEYGLVTVRRTRIAELGDARAARRDEAVLGRDEERVQQEQACDREELE